ncbi:MAG: adenylate/guanylate cyclase domain-containing protein [Burkholderiaceae bacterium]
MKSERSGETWIRPLRLSGGLVLFVFILTHFSNHALGLVSLNAMEIGRDWFHIIWHNRVAESILLLALVSHWLLGLWKIYCRGTLRMPVTEAVQIIFGLAIPPLLAGHVIATRVSGLLYGSDTPFTSVVLFIWVLDPAAGLRQLALFCAAWVHGCIGMSYWLRIRSWYPRFSPLLLSAAVLVPVVALLGVTQAGREVSALAAVPGFVEQLNAQRGAPSPEQRAFLAQIRYWTQITIFSLLALTLVARLVRLQLDRRRQMVRIRYLDGHQVRTPIGWTILESSRFAGIAHASTCGGRARCSTCRIRVDGDPTLLPPPEPIEQRLLDRINAPLNVRLACQLRPRHDVTVAQLVPVQGAQSITHTGDLSAEEREVAVLFADLREFTRFAEHKLPYDVVFILNRYFEAVGGAVQSAGGIANQYTGDGVMALFGTRVTADVACQQAIVAAADIIQRTAALSAALGAELESPLRVGIGIHVGPAVIGEMGYADTRYLAAVGDTTNTASRLEALTKDYGCDLIISEEALVLAGVTVEDSPPLELTLRNRESLLRVATVRDVERLARRVRAAAAPAV